MEENPYKSPAIPANSIAHRSLRMAGCISVAVAAFAFFMAGYAVGHWQGYRDCESLWKTETREAKY